MMLAYERLVAGFGAGPRAVSLLDASASVRPVGGAAATVAVAMPRTYPEPTPRASHVLDQ